MRDMERMLCTSVDFEKNNPIVDLIERGKMMSILHRLQSILVVQSANFDYIAIKQLQVFTLLKKND
jgi:hypothetical protein